MSLSSVIKGDRLLPVQQKGVTAQRVGVNGRIPSAAVTVREAPALGLQAAALRAQAAAALQGQAGVAAPEPEAEQSRAAEPVPAPDPVAMAEAKARRIVMEAESRAELMIDDAVQRAERMIAAARAEAEQQGREQGRLAGLAAAQAEAEQLRQEAQALLQQAQREARGIVEQSRLQLADLAVAIARRIVRRQVELDPAALADMVSAALAQVRGAVQVTLQLSPEDAAHVEQQQLRWPLAEFGIGSLQVQPDATLQRGDVVLHSELGQVDGRIASRLEQMQAELQEVLRHDGDQ